MKLLQADVYDPNKFYADGILSSNHILSNSLKSLQDNLKLLEGSYSYRSIENGIVVYLHGDISNNGRICTYKYKELSKDKKNALSDLYSLYGPGSDLPDSKAGDFLEKIYVENNLDIEGLAQQYNIKQDYPVIYSLTKAIIQ